MTRDDAIRLVDKLQALADPARNPNEAERTAASRKAAKLVRKFGLDRRDTVRPQTQPRAERTRPRPAPQPAGRAGEWDFDWRTGAASGNVKVEHYNSPRDWKIEIPL